MCILSTTPCDIIFDMDIEKILFENADKKYAEFQRKLIPNIKPSKIIGVRTPMLRKIAKEISKSKLCESFLNNLPHKYFEENQLHSFVICEMKDFDECVAEVEKFLPYVDNWATCDQLSPKIFKKHTDKLKIKIYKWIKSDKTYTIRFGIEMAMTYFLGGNFDEDLMNEIAKIGSDEYYVKMMVAWYFATALTKNWDETIKIIETKSLEPWTHNKTIQKARESYRITDKQKTYLKTLKI